MEGFDNGTCSVDGCRNIQSDSKYFFFTLPREFKRRVEWLRVIGRPDLLNRMNAGNCGYRVCSKHFDKSAISELVVQKLKPLAMPTRYLPMETDMHFMRYKAEEGLADASTQTYISYGNEIPVEEKDIFVEVDGRTVLIKKEKDPISTVYPEMNFFSIRSPIKTESDIEMAEPEVKKRKQ